MGFASRKSLAVSILFYIISGGGYSFYWIFRNAFRVYRVTGQRGKLVISFFAIFGIAALFLVPVVMLFFIEWRDPDGLMLRLFRIGLALLALFVYIFGAIGSRDVAIFVSKELSCLCSPQKAFWLTFFGGVSFFYLQARINTCRRP